MVLQTNDLTSENKERVNSILEVIIAYAGLDFSKKTEVLGNGDILDAIGAGVNMLGEELQTSTVSLSEKEQLLKEVHHRVKNNLQIVSSLLKLQSENALDQKYLDLITDSRNRINSMAIVHELLYSTSDLSKVEISRYIEYLSSSIHSAFLKPNADIEFDFKIEKGLYFDIDRMIALGLIINEVISNSFKYAFPENKGRITIEVKTTEKGHELIIGDNGVGFPTGFDFQKHANLGMQLIQMLSAQIDGTVEIRHAAGSMYHIIFPQH